MIEQSHDSLSSVHMLNIYTFVYKSNTYPWLQAKSKRVHTMRMCIRYKLQKEMDRLGLSGYKLAKLSGVNQPNISRILNGETLNPGQEIVSKLAKALGVSSGVLMDEEKNMNYIPKKGSPLAVSDTDAERQYSVKLRSVPVLSSDEIRNGLPDENVERRYVETELEVTRVAYAWEVKSNQLGSMGLPFTMPVDVVLIVEPDLTPVDGNFILVTDGDGPIMIKRLEIDGPNHYLHSLNSQHVPLMMADTYAIKGTVISINMKTI